MRSTDFICLILLGLCTLTTARPETKAQCGYPACPTVKPGMINVHLVPHTHDDVGWLKTIDQYFYGNRNSIQRAGVQYIIDGVIEDLIRDPNKRFIWVETAFLWQWWKEQDETMRDKMRTLVNNGQLEITGGAWSMHDEAVTHYHSIIDQFTWGFRKLDELFGTCARPVIGWQIDPFGHSRESASMMAQMGFDALFFGRLDYQDKLHRMETGTAELVWQASENLGQSSWLFTHVTHNDYRPPPGFCFDILCNDEPFIDSKRSPDYNVDKLVKSFIDFATNQSTMYVTENIIELMGEDFHYQNARQWFKNMDKLIKYVNEQQSNGSNVNVFYSSPSCYIKAVNEAGLTWTTKQDDFFPYPNDKNSYWTGYYTSRPTLKYFERKGNNLLQSVKQLYSLAELGPEEQWTDISSLREMMGVMQHHDAITGTEKQHVAEDYALRLTEAFVDAHNTAEKAINKLMSKTSDPPVVDMKPCLLLNISQCATSEESSSFVVTVYNPLSRVNSQYIRLPVPQNEFKVTDLTGVDVTSQLVPIPQSVLDIPGRDSSASQELVFKAENVPALGFKSYYIEKIPGDFTAPAPVTNKFNIGHNRLQANVNPKTGLLDSVTFDDINIPLTQNFLYYEGTEDSTRSSGAYVFRPRDNTATPFSAANISTVTGDLVEEIHQTFGDWVSQVIRVYAGESHVEFEWQVGPIPIDDDVGKEIITRYSTGWATDGIFYTDSNGRETLQRKRDFRPTWEVEISEPVSANYYPITTHIAIKGDGSQLSVLPDRAQGGSSINDGDIELMLHRRLLKDDGYGVKEALNETAYDVGLVARGRHIVLFGPDSRSSPSVTAQQRQLSQSRMVLNPLVLLTPTSFTLQEWQSNFNSEYSGLNTALPDNVQILTLEPWKDDSLLLRLEHYLETNDDAVLSQPTVVVLENLFAAFTITSAQEMTLGGNQNIKENVRLSWNVEGFSDVKKTRQVPSQANRLTVTLEPMQIRTFVIEVAPREFFKQADGMFATFCQYLNSLKHIIFN